MLSEANFLILDEPTNHLDIVSKEILENAIKNYTGTVLYVSHDRYFINQTASRIIELKDKIFTITSAIMITMKATGIMIPAPRQASPPYPVIPCQRRTPQIQRLSLPGRRTRQGRQPSERKQMI